MKLPVSIPLIFVVLLLLQSSAIAETRYISDLLVVTVRSQKGKTYKALESLISSSPIEILGEDKTYVKVRTKKGTVGYILKQYTTKKQPKELKIKQLNTKLAQLKETLEKIQNSSNQSEEVTKAQQAKIEELSSKLSQTEKKLKTISLEYQRLLKDSDNVVQVSKENEQLVERNTQVSTELEILREENQNFHRSNMIQWFLAGAGVFFGGWLIGKISRRKQRGFSRI